MTKTKQVKSAILLSLAERITLTATSLARDNGLDEEDVERILRLAHQAVTITNYRGFGE